MCYVGRGGYRAGIDKKAGRGSPGVLSSVLLGGVECAGVRFEIFIKPAVVIDVCYIAKIYNFF